MFQNREAELLTEWTGGQVEVFSAGGRLSSNEVRSQSTELLSLLSSALQSDTQPLEGKAWAPLKEFLANVSRSRALQGFSPSETANFVLSLKKPIFDRLRAEVDGSSSSLADDLWEATNVLDKLALYTTEIFQKSREELISRQQQDMMELSTPVVSLWEGILALPIIGALDSARTQVVMETLLQRIVTSGAEIAIIDITGVPTVDTLTAQHLLKTITAARLMGAECIISGIRPQIAQTIVHLGVDLRGVTTKSSLADALRLALSRTGRAVVRVAKAATHSESAGDRSVAPMSD